MGCGGDTIGQGTGVLVHIIVNILNLFLQSLQTAWIIPALHDFYMRNISQVQFLAHFLADFVSISHKNV